MGHQYVRPLMTSTFSPHHDIDRIPKRMNMDDFGTSNARGKLTPSQPLEYIERSPPREKSGRSKFI